MRLKLPVICFAITFVFLFVACAQNEERNAPAKLSERTLWMSDLHQPVNDPDDHYDLAFGLKGGLLDDALVVTDQGKGRPPARQAVRDISRIVGVVPPPVVIESNVKRQLDFLKSSSPASVDVVTLGSLSGLASLLRRNPSLVESRVREVIIFAGDAKLNAPPEYNVALDPVAFREVLGSPLKIKWVPCFDGGLWKPGRASFIQTTDSFLLHDTRPRVYSWFERYIGDRFGVRNLWAAGVLASRRPPGTIWEEGTFRFASNGSLVKENTQPSNIEKFEVINRRKYEGWTLQTALTLLSTL